MTVIAQKCAFMATSETNPSDRTNIQKLLKGASKTMCRNARLIVPALALVLIPCHFMAMCGYMAFIITRISILVKASLSAKPCMTGYATLQDFLTRTASVWRGLTVTLFHVGLSEPIYSLLLSNIGVLVDGLVPKAVLTLILCLGPIPFVYSDAACKLGLIVSAVEEGVSGAEAIKRGGRLVKNMEMRGVVLTWVLMFVEQATYAPISTFGGVKYLIIFFSAAVQLFVYFLYAEIYRVGAGRESCMLKNN